MGRPLHVKQDVVRLWQAGKCRFSDTIVNEQPLIPGKIGRLTHVLEHRDSPDLHHWYEKQNRYSTMEAIMRYRGDAMAAQARLFGTSLERSMLLRKMFYKMPFRYLLLYFYHLIWKGAWRDGKTGCAWAKLRTEVYRMCELKLKEMQQTSHIPEVPRAAHGGYDPRILASSLQQELVPDSLKESS